VQAPPRNRLHSLRARACLLGATALLAGGLIGVPQAAATGIEGGNSFNELSEKAQQEPTTTAETQTTETAKETSNSQKTIFIAIGAAIVLLIAIAFVIVRDARRVAPAGAEDFGEGSSGRDNAIRQRKRREKARAARRQRKKNR
jgi:H+/gluconate symporter-like permease